MPATLAAIFDSLFSARLHSATDTKARGARNTKCSMINTYKYMRYGKKAPDDPTDPTEMGEEERYQHT